MMFTMSVGASATSNEIDTANSIEIVIEEQSNSQTRSAGTTYYSSLRMLPRSHLVGTYRDYGTSSSYFICSIGALYGLDFITPDYSGGHYASLEVSIRTGNSWFSSLIDTEELKFYSNSSQAAYFSNVPQNSNKAFQFETWQSPINANSVIMVGR